jgi:hypothetical protein
VIILISQTNDALEKLLKQRGLAQMGRKEVKINRLQSYHRKLLSERYIPLKLDDQNDLASIFGASNDRSESLCFKKESLGIYLTNGDLFSLYPENHEVSFSANVIDILFSLLQTRYL